MFVCGLYMVKLASSDECKERSVLEKPLFQNTTNTRRAIYDI